jgi:hypothetical protein
VRAGLTGAVNDSLGLIGKAYAKDLKYVGYPQINIDYRYADTWSASCKPKLSFQR